MGYHAREAVGAMRLSNLQARGYAEQDETYRYHVPVYGALPFKGSATGAEDTATSTLNRWWDVNHAGFSDQEASEFFDTDTDATVTEDTISSVMKEASTVGHMPEGHRLALRRQVSLSTRAFGHEQSLAASRAGPGHSVQVLEQAAARHFARTQRRQQGREAEQRKRGHGRAGRRNARHGDDALKDCPPPLQLPTSARFKSKMAHNPVELTSAHSMVEERKLAQRHDRPQLVLLLTDRWLRLVHAESNRPVWRWPLRFPTDAAGNGIAKRGEVMGSNAGVAPMMPVVMEASTLRAESCVHVCSDQRVITVRKLTGGGAACSGASPAGEGWACLVGSLTAVAVMSSAMEAAKESRPDRQKLRIMEEAGARLETRTRD